MNKTVSSVIDDINEWPNPQDGGRIVYYVTAFFTDGEVGSAGRKDMDAALEVQGLLQEAIGQELDFTLEPKKPTKSGKAAWKIVGFGTPGGAATYTAPGVQGGGDAASPGRVAPVGLARARSPEPSNEQASIRASVALKAAVELLRPAQEKHETGQVTPDLVIAVAEWMYEWLEKKTSEPAPSAYPQPVVAAPSEPSTDHQAGAGSEDPSVPGSVSPGAESAGSQGSPEGEAGDPVPHERDINWPGAKTTHEHDWQPHSNLHGWLSCSCGENRKKYGLEGAK